MIRLLLMMLLSSGLSAQSLLEVEVTKHQEGPDVVLMAKNHTDSTYIVSVNVESHGMTLSREVPFDVRLAGGRTVRLITLTPIPGKPWTYRQSYSFKPVPPKITPPTEEVMVSDVVQEVLDILNEDPPVKEDPPERMPEPKSKPPEAPQEEPEVRGISIENTETPPAPVVRRTGSTVRRSAYIPDGVSDEFGHGTPRQLRFSPVHTRRVSTYQGAYIPAGITSEFGAGRSPVSQRETRPRTPSREPERPSKHEPAQLLNKKVLGLRTVAYRVPDLEEAKEWYSEAFSTQPYFDQPFYVGYNIGGYELGLQPAGGGARPGESVISYWGVEDVDDMYAHLLDLGARAHEPPEDVGGGIRAAAVKDPWGNVIGLLYNPHFGRQ